MIDKDAAGAVSRFMTKLEGTWFTMARPENTEENYTAEREAVDDFVKTDLFQDIMRLI